jgi:hypothetical protein
MARSAFHPRPAQLSIDRRLDIAPPAPLERGVGMSARKFTIEDQNEYVLAEFRCALIKTKLAQYDIEAVALALKLRLVTAEQAVGMFWDSEAVRFVGITLGPELDLEANQEVRTEERATV